MDFGVMKDRALKIRDLYNKKNQVAGEKNRDVEAYIQGFLADFGQLSKLVMMKQGYRKTDNNLDQKLSHELSDCLWSIIVIADELGMDLETGFTNTMTNLEDTLN